LKRHITDIILDFEDKLINITNRYLYRILDGSTLYSIESNINYLLFDVGRELYIDVSEKVAVEVTNNIYNPSIIDVHFFKPGTKTKYKNTIEMFSSLSFFVKKTPPFREGMN